MAGAPRETRLRIHAEETIELAEALERGRLSPREYVRLRAEMVGEGNVVDFVILPVLSSFLREVVNWIERFVPSRPPNGSSTRRSADPSDQPSAKMTGDAFRPERLPAVPRRQTARRR
jgi:hypothetical protein